MFSNISATGNQGAEFRAARLQGRFRPPGDKSISHRALILSGLAEGESFITGLNPGNDCGSTRRVLAHLGARFADEAEGVRVRGTGGRLAEPRAVLDCGNSGTTLRLMMGPCAASPGLKLFTGDASLCLRPMNRVADPLAAMGAEIWLREGRYAPLAVRGNVLRPIRYEMPLASAQVKSALLLAGSMTAGRTEVVERVPSRDHTERLLGFFGSPVARDGNRLWLDGPARLEGRRITVPGDISAAAFILVAGILLPGSEVTALGVSVNPTRTAVLRILERMGARIGIDAREPEAGGSEEVADVTASHSPLVATTIAGAEAAAAIDELPVLAVAACCARGTTRIEDAAELRVKESDRIAGMVAGLTRLGAQVEETPDGLVIQGGGADFTFAGGTVDAGRDHRVAMAFAVAGLKARGRVEILGLDSVPVSDPAFFETLEALRRV